MNYNRKLTAHEIWETITLNSIESTALSDWYAQSQHGPYLLIAKELLNHSNDEVLALRGGKIGYEKNDTLLDLIMSKKNKFLHSVLMDRGLYIDALPEIAQFMLNIRHILLKDNLEIHKGVTIESQFYDNLFANHKDDRQLKKNLEYIKRGFRTDQTEEEISIIQVGRWIDFFGKLDLENKQIDSIYQEFTKKFVTPFWAKFLHSDAFNSYQTLNPLLIKAMNMGLNINEVNEKGQTVLDTKLIDKNTKKFHNFKSEIIKEYLEIGITFNEYPSELGTHLVLALLQDNYKNIQETASLFYPYCKDLDIIEENAINFIRKKTDNPKLANQKIELFLTYSEKCKLEKALNNNLDVKKKIKL